MGRVLPYSSESSATGAVLVSSGSWRATSPWMVVSWRTMSPVLLVVAARSPEAESTLRVSAPVAVSSVIQRGLSPSLS
ncbi:hypothetical protein C5746_05540 [Streptomyces atratus]|uniref:Uncharacterized protein n=1 Tax=Streptomyces atratus TaxID=1893 RepID=A0A2Z5J844_STRAR|nr:hypothetical protein C5746_05540 [Streptomyces atratus]